MTKKDNLKEFTEIQLDLQEIFKQVVGETRIFPRYTTQIINLANQNAQGTRPDVVGQMSELIKKCPKKDFKSWKSWYLERYPDAIKKATVKVESMIEKLKESMKLIDEKMISEWVEDLVITKTAEGLIIQEMILKHVSNLRKINYKLASPDEESKNIDGFIGDNPVQIKPWTYLSKKSTVRESINIEIIYYKKTEKYLYIYLKSN